MVFDVESMTSQEILATKAFLESIVCTHENTACVDCPCFEICTFIRKVTEKCMDVLEERSFS